MERQPAVAHPAKPDGQAVAVRAAVQAEPGEQAIRVLEWRAEVGRALRSARRRLWAQA
ncbi:MAG: hypothetical protein ABSC51_04850 [Gaiellaceae bacterium]